MNFVGSINTAREDLESSAAIRYRYFLYPEKVRLELAGLSVETMREGIASTRRLLKSVDSELRIAAFLFLFDVWKTNDAVDLCIDFAFGDESGNARGFAIEKICKDKEFWGNAKLRHSIANVVGICINDEEIVRITADSWISAVSGYLNAEHMRQTLDQLERRRAAK